MPKKLALLIGVSQYGEDTPSLSAPPNDVKAMQRVLEDHQMGNFDKVESLFDPDAMTMKGAIKDLFKGCDREDLALIFFSGHGFTDDNDDRLYLGARGTSKNNFDIAGVAANFIQQQSENFPIKRQIIILDCCYSGAFGVGWQAKGVDLNLKQELGQEGRVVLTSSSATQRSFEQENADLVLSLYTQYLVEGIETGAADKNEDGEIHVQELHQYAKAKVQEVKPNMKPNIIIHAGEGYNILLSQAPRNAPELKFRRLVEHYISRGEISSLGEISQYRREFFKTKQEEFSVTDEKAAEIIDSVLEPFRKRLANLERYREFYQREVEYRYPLDERKVSDLKDWQQAVLGLRDEDVALIQDQIVRHHLRQNSVERQRIPSHTPDRRPRYPEPRQQQPNGIREMLLWTAMIIAGWLVALVLAAMKAQSNLPLESFAGFIGGFINGLAIWLSQSSSSHGSQKTFQAFLFCLGGAIVGILIWRLLPSDSDSILPQAVFSFALGVVSLFLYPYASRFISRS